MPPLETGTGELVTGTLAQCGSSSLTALFVIWVGRSVVPSSEPMKISPPPLVGYRTYVRYLASGDQDAARPSPSCGERSVMPGAPPRQPLSAQSIVNSWRCDTGAGGGVKRRKAIRLPLGYQAGYAVGGAGVVREVAAVARR